MKSSTYPCADSHLGLHRKSQLSAIRGELGRYPLGIDIIANLMKYRAVLQKKDKDSILYKDSRDADYAANTTRNTLSMYSPKMHGPLVN